MLWHCLHTDAVFFLRVIGHRGADAFSVCIKEKRICIVTFPGMIQLHVFPYMSHGFGHDRYESVYRITNSDYRHG